MRKDSQRSCVKRCCIQDIGWQRQNRWRSKDSQRSCVKRSCIQDIGWQIGFRWRGGRHLLCIPTPLYRNNIQLLLPAFTNGASRALRKINIFHLSLQVLFLALLFSNISYSHPLILFYSFFYFFFYHYGTQKWIVFSFEID